MPNHHLFISEIELPITDHLWPRLRLILPARTELSRNRRMTATRPSAQAPYGPLSAGKTGYLHARHSLKAKSVELSTDNGVLSK